MNKGERAYGLMQQKYLRCKRRKTGHAEADVSLLTKPLESFHFTSIRDWSAKLQFELTIFRF